jgi:hypothetical protein
MRKIKKYFGFPKEKKTRIKAFKKTKIKSKYCFITVQKKIAKKKKFEKNHVTSCRVYFFPMQGHNYLR